MKRSLAQFMPILDWGRTYNRQTVSSDLLAAVIVTIMLIPQSLAYALPVSYTHLTLPTNREV